MIHSQAGPCRVWEAALVAPAVLSIIMSTFEDGSERRKALGIFAWIGGAGSVPAGALLNCSR